MELINNNAELVGKYSINEDGVITFDEGALEDLQKDAETFKEMGITFEEKAFYDILKAIKEKYEFEYAEDKLIELAKKVKAVVDDKAKYTDWSSKSDIKASLQSDIIRLLNRNGYPPMTFEDVYARVIAQVENFKKFAD